MDFDCGQWIGSQFIENTFSHLMQVYTFTRCMFNLWCGLIEQSLKCSVFIHWVWGLATLNKTKFQALILLTNFKKLYNMKRGKYIIVFQLEYHCRVQLLPILGSSSTKLLPQSRYGGVKAEQDLLSLTCL